MILICNVHILLNFWLEHGSGLRPSATICFNSNYSNRRHGGVLMQDLGQICAGLVFSPITM